MKIEEGLRPLLAEHPFFAGMEEAHLDVLVGCAKNVRFDPGQLVRREGDEAAELYLLRHGRLAVDLHVHPRPVTVKTVGPGEILGWSWLRGGARWAFDLRAVELSRAVALDGACLRHKCEADPRLGFELVRRFATDLEQRLYGAWFQMVDMYGPPKR